MYNASRKANWFGYPRHLLWTISEKMGVVANISQDLLVPKFVLYDKVNS